MDQCWSKSLMLYCITRPLSVKPFLKRYIDRLMEERCNSVANALELRLYCTNLLIYGSSGREELVMMYDWLCIVDNEDSSLLSIYKSFPFPLCFCFIDLYPITTDFSFLSSCLRHSIYTINLMKYYFEKSAILLPPDSAHQTPQHGPLAR